MELDLKGKVALITGGSKGIGLACAQVLAAEGCPLHLAARSESDLLDAKKDLESRFGISADIHCVDLSVGDEARRLAADLPDVDILVNNAGAIPRGDLWQIDEPYWREAWDLKVFGYINLCRAAPGLYRRWYSQCSAHGLYPGAGRKEPRGRHPRRRGQPRPYSYAEAGNASAEFRPDKIQRFGPLERTAACRSAARHAAGYRERRGVSRFGSGALHYRYRGHRGRRNYRLLK